MNRKGVPSMFTKAQPTLRTANLAFPEMMVKNQRVTQLMKLAKQSKRLCTLQVCELRGCGNA